MTKLDKDLQILMHIVKYCERIKKVAPIFKNDFNNLYQIKILLISILALSQFYK